jgi:hypothetical protein
MFALSWPVKAVVTAFVLILVVLVTGFISLWWVLSRYGSPFK